MIDCHEIYQESWYVNEMAIVTANVNFKDLSFAKDKQILLVVHCRNGVFVVYRDHVFENKKHDRDPKTP